MICEKWKRILQDDRYEVSNFGRIRRGKKILSVRIVARCYSGQRFCDHEYYVHRLVAEAFLGPIPAGFVVNHYDFNTLNNHVSNLEICTPKENSMHARQRDWYMTQTRLEIFYTVTFTSIKNPFDDGSVSAT